MSHSTISSPPPPPQNFNQKAVYETGRLIGKLTLIGESDQDREGYLGGDSDWFLTGSLPYVTVDNKSGWARSI